MPLENGPVSIFEDGHFVGETMLSRCTSNEEQYLPYGVELKIGMKYQTTEKKLPAHQVKSIGTSIYFYKYKLSTTVYTINNRGFADMELYIEHPRKNANAHLHDTPPPLGISTTNFYRFLIKSRAQKLEKFVVIERDQDIEVHPLSTITEKQIRVWKEQQLLTEDIYQKCTKIVEINKEVADLKAKATFKTQHTTRLTSEQEHVFRVLTGLSRFNNDATSGNKTTSAISGVSESPAFKETQKYFTTIKLDIDNSIGTVGQQQIEIQKQITALATQLETQLTSMGNHEYKVPV